MRFLSLFRYWRSSAERSNTLLFKVIRFAIGAKASQIENFQSRTTRVFALGAVFILLIVNLARFYPISLLWQLIATGAVVMLVRAWHRVHCQKFVSAVINQNTRHEPRLALGLEHDEHSGLLVLAQNLRDGSYRFARNSDDQIKVVQSALASIQDMSNMVENAADFSKSSSLLLGSMNNTIGFWNKSLKTSQSSMLGIENVYTNLEEISILISSISSRTKLIEEIAREAKIVAFNAMVEAARAGEHGRGFMVVAQAIQNFADGCAKASEQIKHISANGSDRTGAIVQSMKDQLKEAVSSHSEVLSRSNEIGEAVSNLAGLLVKIDDAVRQQERGIVVCSEAMGHVFAAIASSRKITDQSGRAAADLQEIASSMVIESSSEKSDANLSSSSTPRAA